MSINNTILLISERQEQFALATDLLSEAGYSIVFTPNVREGIEAARVELPRLIVSELAGRQIDGLELCNLIRSDSRLSSTPILLIGDLAEDSSIVSDAHHCGANEYLQKPIEQGFLFDRCYSLIASNARDIINIRSEPVIFVNRHALRHAA